MIFGTREKRVALGKFTSEECTSCKKSNEYVFFRITKYIVVLFINLIPIGNSYECECIKCDDKLSIDKKAGSKLAKQKFSDENGNLNFLIFFRLFVAAIVIAAAIVLPLMFVKPPTSPQILKDLVEEDGQYTILDKNADLLGIVTIVDGVKKLDLYDDFSRYKSETGDVFTMHKRYEEVIDENGSHMAPLVDNFGSIVDDNLIKVQRYYYDIAKGTYGFHVGVVDLSTIVRSGEKTVYSINVYNSASDIVIYKLVVYNNDTREIDVRFEKFEDGSEELLEIRVIEKSNGLSISETIYMSNSSGSQISYIGAVDSSSSANEFIDFVMNNSLTIGYIETFTYYSDTAVVTSIETSAFDSQGNVSLSTINYSITIKDGYYILQDIEDPA